MKKHQKILSFFLIIAVFLISAENTVLTVHAEPLKTKLLTLNMAKDIAIANSEKLESLESSVETKRASLLQSIRKIKEKRRSMSTFRWSPLLNFKFPESPTLAEESEFELKPIQIQVQIDETLHNISDTKLAEYESVNNLYVDIVVTQKTIAFEEECLEVLKETLTKNRAKLATGEAKKADVESMEKDVSALEKKIAGNMRKLEAAKGKLGKKLDMDISTGYTFEDPFQEVELSRTVLDYLIQYTLERSQAYYEASMDAEFKLITLRTNYKLMSSRYGGKMSYISTYVNQAMNGEKIDKKAFKKKYEEFLKAIDAPWTGKLKILFIKIPKEWFKGEIDGIRYVEDESYSLYEATLEYQDALNTKNSTRDDVISQVEDTYNSYVSSKNAYKELVEQTESARANLEADSVLNTLGELTYEELKSEKDDYENLQNDLMAAYGSYSQTIYSFDRLTCGGITEWMKGGAMGLQAGGGGMSYVEEELKKGAFYYIESIVSEEEFRLGISIPENFTPKVTDFELWIDGIQVGERTPADKSVRHLTLARENISEAKLSLYNGEQFVDDCVIDPDTPSGELIIREYKVSEGEKNELGSYSVEENENTGMVTILPATNYPEEIKKYRIETKNGTRLGNGQLQNMGSEFRYLSIVTASFEDLIVILCDEEGQELYKAYFDTANRKIMRIQERNAE